MSTENSDKTCELNDFPLVALFLPFCQFSGDAHFDLIRATAPAAFVHRRNQRKGEKTTVGPTQSGDTKRE